MSGFETRKRVTRRETALQSDDGGLQLMNALALNSPTALATNCVLIGHCNKADVAWTTTEFRMFVSKFSRRFVELGIFEKTAPHVTNRTSARFRFFHSLKRGLSL